MVEPDGAMSSFNVIGQVDLDALRLFGIRNLAAAHPFELKIIWLYVKCWG